MSSLRILARQSAVYGLSTILGRFLNYLLVPLYTHLFLPEQYGIVTEFYSYAAFLMVVFTYGMETSFLRYAGQDTQLAEKYYSGGFYSLLASSMVLVFLVLIFLNPLAALMRHPGEPGYLLLFAGILFFDTLSTLPFARLRLQNRAYHFSLLRVVNICLTIVLNLLFLLWLPKSFLQNLGLNDPVFSVFMANFMASFCTFLLLIPQLPSPGFFESKFLKILFSYGWPMLPAGLAGMVNETLDRILIKYLLPTSQSMHDLGIYGACYKLSIVLTLFVQAYRLSAEPFFFANSSASDARTLNARATFWFNVFCGLVFCATLFFMDQLQHFIGPAFREGLNVVPVLLLANWFLGLYYASSVWFKLSGKTGAGAIIAIVGAIITLVLNFLLIPRLGYAGAAWTTLACYAGMLLISFVWGNRHFPVPYRWKAMGLTVAWALCLYFVFASFAPQHPVFRILFGCLGLLIYLAPFAPDLLALRKK